MQPLWTSCIAICFLLVPRCGFSSSMSTENCSLFRQRQDKFQMDVTKTTSCGISKDWCSQRNAIFFSRRRVCGCKCKVGFATYRKDNDTCVKNKNIHEGCTLYSGGGTKPWNPIGMLKLKRSALLRMTLTTSGSSCFVDPNTSRYFKDDRWTKFQNGASPFRLVKRRLNLVTRNMNGSASANRTVISYSIKWQTRRKNIAYLKGRLVKMGVVCDGVSNCAVFKVQGKLDSIHCWLSTTTASITSTRQKAPTTVTSLLTSTTTLTEKSRLSTKSSLLSMSATEVTTKSDKETAGAGGHHKSGDDALQFSVTGAIVGTAVTMALVLVMGIILGYFCKMKKRVKVERSPSTDTLQGTHINNFGVMNGVYGRNRSISELEDASSVYSEISNLTNVSKLRPPPPYKVLDGSLCSSIRNSNDKLPLPPTATIHEREIVQRPSGDELGPPLPPTPEYIRKCYPVVQSNNDELKKNNTVSESEVSQSDKLVSLDNPVYEVPVDERPPSPAYVEPDQLAMSDPKDAANNLDYLEVVI